MVRWIKSSIAGLKGDTTVFWVGGESKARGTCANRTIAVDNIMVTVYNARATASGALDGGLHARLKTVSSEEQDEGKPTLLPDRSYSTTRSLVRGVTFELIQGVHSSTLPLAPTAWSSLGASVSEPVVLPR